MRQWTLGFGRASLTPRAKHPGGPNRGYALGCSLTRVPVGHACVCVDGTGRRWWPAAALLGFGGCDAGEACSVPALSRATLFATAKPAQFSQSVSQLPQIDSYYTTRTRIR